MPSELGPAHTLRLPERAGPRPKTTPCAPHSQVDQLVPVPQRMDISAKLVEHLTRLPDVEPGYSRRAPPGSIGLYMHPGKACADARCFLLGNEFAHVHCRDDGSLHAILPEPLRTEAIEKGWAETHPLAGQPTVSVDTVMIYAPRNDAEAETVIAMVTASWANAREAG